MGTMAVNPLLLKLSAPMILSMLVQALYNVVDSIFISRVSEAALTAVSLSFTVQNIMIAVGVGTGVGVNALVSRALGEKNQKQAARIAGNGMFLTLCSSAVCMLFALFCVVPFFEMQTSDAEILRESVNYLSICCFFSQGLFMQLVFEKLLVATGNAKASMLSQLSGAVVNIILDPIFIFGYCGEALSGARGAAIATVIGQWVAALVGLYCCQHKDSLVRLSRKTMRPHMPSIKHIYAIGSPSIAVICVGSVMVLGMNQILMSFSSTAVALFGVYYRLQSFVLMPVFGMNNALMPIVGFNYGARQPKRIVAVSGWAILYVELFMLLGTAIFCVFPAQLLSIFEASETMLAIGVPALRIISLCFACMGFNILASTVFQSLGDGVFSLYISFLRQIILLVPIAFFFSKTGDISLVWWAFPISEVIGLVLCITLLWYEYKKILQPMLQEAKGE